MTKITDNGIRFIIMIPLIVQPISSVLQVTSFELYPSFIIGEDYLRKGIQLNLDYSDSDALLWSQFFQEY